MAFATLGTKIIGYFTEVQYGKTFEYTNIDNDEIILSPLAHGGKNVRYPHKIFVGPCQETRYAFVKKNVVHVITDEHTVDGENLFVVEKWDIRRHRLF